jgi:thiol-disulfide isomerase/thioredoxin
MSRALRFRLRSCCRLSAVALLLLAGLVPLAGCTDNDSAVQGKATLTAAKNGPVEESLTARQVLERMAKTYREAVTYTDRGIARVQYTQGDKPTKVEFPFSVTFAQPNRLWLKAYEGEIVCDGKRLCALHESVHGYVRTAPAPEKLTIPKVYADEFLWTMLNERQAGGALQLELLLNDKFLDTVLGGATGEPELLDADAFDIETCYRLKLPTPQGDMLFWVGKRSFLLRRVEHPVDEFRKMLEQEGPVRDVSISAEFLSAKLNEPLEEHAFRFVPPEGAKEVKQFIGPAPADIMGKKVGDFEFTSLAGGQKITTKSLEGKVIVLDFWASWCTFCLQKMPDVAKAYEKFKDNDKVRFLAVSIDQPNVTDDQLKAKLAELKVDLPLARDPQMTAFSVFKIPGVPARIILGPDGTLQAGTVGLPPPGVDPVADVIGKVEALLAGKDLFAATLAEFERSMQEPPVEPKEAHQPTEMPEVQIQPKSDPQTLKLQTRWVCKEVVNPGNLLVVESGAGAPKLYAIDSMRAIAEINPADGSLVARHEPNIPKDVALAFLRTAANRDGQRFFAASAVGQTQVFVFDDKWQLHATYSIGRSGTPSQDGDTPSHQENAIGDARLVDLDGDGQLELAVGCLGKAGVRVVSTQGQEIWQDEKSRDVVSLAVSPADQQGHRKLLCICPSGVAVLDHAGKPSGEISTGERHLRWLTSARLAGADEAYAGFAFAKASPEAPVTDALIGIDLAGKELWSYALPTGQQPWLEQLAAGRIVAGQRHWLAAAADGSLHFVSADGKLLDRFSVGTALSGFAAVEVDNQSLLILATGDRLEAWRVETKTGQ